MAERWSWCPSRRSARAATASHGTSWLERIVRACFYKITDLAIHGNPVKVGRRLPASGKVPGQIVVRLGEMVLDTDAGAVIEGKGLPVAIQLILVAGGSALPVFFVEEGQTFQVGGARQLCQ